MNISIKETYEPAVRFAGEEWLRLYEQFGNRLRVVDPESDIHIGTMREIAERGISPRLEERLAANGELKQGSYWIEIRERTVVLAGDHAPSALYAVYDLFKRFAGVNWVYPGEDAAIGEPEAVPADGIALLCEPWFGRRGFVFETINDPPYIKSQIDWLAKNRVGEIFFTFMLWDQLKEEVAPEIVKRGLAVTLGGHSMKFFLDKKEAEGRLAADHPYTAKRQLDYADPSWEEEVVGKVADYCASVPNLTRVSLWPEDISSQSSDFIEHYIKHTERLNRRLREVMPHVETEHIAYNAGLSWQMLDRQGLRTSNEVDTLLAFWGRDYRYVLDRSPAESDRRAESILADWIAQTHAQGKKLTVFEYYSDHYMYSALFPSIPRTIAADMLHYRELGVDGMTNLVVPCPGYPDYPWRWTNVFNGYVYCRALWGDPLERILDDYYAYYAPEVRSHIKSMFELVERIVTAVTAWNIPLFPNRVVDAAKIADKTAVLPEMDALLGDISQQLADKLEPGCEAGNATVYLRHLISLAERLRAEWNNG